MQLIVCVLWIVLIWKPCSSNEVTSRFQRISPFGKKEKCNQCKDCSWIPPSTMEGGQLTPFQLRPFSLLTVEMICSTPDSFYSQVLKNIWCFPSWQRQFWNQLGCRFSCLILSFLMGNSSATSEPVVLLPSSVLLLLKSCIWLVDGSVDHFGRFDGWIVDIDEIFSVVYPTRILILFVFCKVLCLHYKARFHSILWYRIDQ
jgi:hypothetical protein